MGVVSNHRSLIMFPFTWVADLAALVARTHNSSWFAICPDPQSGLDLVVLGRGAYDVECGTYGSGTYVKWDCGCEDGRPCQGVVGADTIVARAARWAF